MTNKNINVVIHNIGWDSEAEVFNSHEVVWHCEGHINARSLDFYYFIETQLDIFVDSLTFTLGVEENEFFDFTKLERCKLLAKLKAVAYHNIVECKHFSGEEQLQLVDTLRHHWSSILYSLERANKVEVTVYQLLALTQIIDYIEQYVEQIGQQIHSTKKGVKNEQQM
jgi:hypothetical protein